MSENEPNEASKDAPKDAEHKEPSLGPACLVVVILSLALICIFCAFGSFIMFSDQYPLAIKGINVQLIPWIKTSQLKESDQQVIIAKLEELLPQIESRSISNQQLTRLHNCLQDNPVLLWGAVESIVAQGNAMEALTETEKETLERVTQRLLHGAAIRKLGRNDLEFAIQNCSRVREDGQSLEVVDGLSPEQVREFMQRSEQLVEQNGIPNEPFDKTAGEAFAILVESALTVE